MKPDHEVVHAANALTSWTSGVSAEITELARNVAALMERNLAGKPKVDSSALAGLEQLSRDFLAKNAFAVGAGTFFATQSVEEDGHALEWWSRGDSGALDKLDCDLTPGSNRYYDYEKLPFFSNAASTGEQTLWGPYLDYLGSGEYVLTFTAPFSVHGTFAGVAGCDILLRDLEPLIMPDLRGIPGDAALINASNRVILGNSGTYLVGERIKAGSSEQQRMELDVPHLGLSLIYSA
ncbi:cache domain-containing protein [Arthrobacter silvisoli]|uniref:cache domain-containing protein n=1 Tax=Arthrobacter silvisoli TaxID=2291022 RepID=UPI000E218791|nr:cache domain-containing protein [Arthrobacter silvisoli]